VVLTMMSRTERRSLARTQRHALPATLSGRIRPGHDLRVVDASSIGLLIETTRRLLPGTHVDLYLETTDARHTTRARVVRCYVGAIEARGIVFYGGLELERPIAWLDFATRRGTAVTAAPV
jgi:hypothetical protein